MLIVMGLTVFVDLITAVAVGIVMASLLFVKRMADLQLANIQMVTRDDDTAGLSDAERAALSEGHGRVVLYTLQGPFGFGAARGMVRRLAGVDLFDAVVLDMSRVPFIDSSASLGVQDVIEQMTERDKAVFLAGVQPAVAATLDRLGVLALLPDGRRPETTEAALSAAASFAAAKP